MAVGFHRQPDCFTETRDQALEPVCAVRMVAGYEAVVDSFLDFANEDAFLCGLDSSERHWRPHEIESVHQAFEKGPESLFASSRAEDDAHRGGRDLSIRYGSRALTILSPRRVPVSTTLRRCDAGDSAAWPT